MVVLTTSFELPGACGFFRDWAELVPRRLNMALDSRRHPAMILGDHVRSHPQVAVLDGPEQTARGTVRVKVDAGVGCEGNGDGLLGP